MTVFFKQPDQLMSEHFMLRVVHQDDFDALFAAASDPLIWEYHPSKRHQKNIFIDFFDAMIGDGCALLILDRRTQEVIGTTRFYDVNEEAGSVAIGYTFLTRAYWGGTANQEIKAILLNHAFGFTGVERVVFHIATSNVRSQKAIEKIGALYSHQEWRGFSPATPIEHCVYYLTRNIDEILKSN